MSLLQGSGSPRDVWQANAAGSERARWYGFLASKPITYGVTLVAMLGNLLCTVVTFRWVTFNSLFIG